MGQTATGHFDGSGVGLAPGANTRRTIQGTYSFATHGGGTGTYAIARVYAGARIVGGWLEVTGTPTAVSGTPSIGINSVGANDILSTASVLGAPWSTVGKKAIVPKVNTPETTSISVAADTDVVVAITTAAINTGIFTLYLDVVG